MKKLILQSMLAAPMLLAVDAQAASTLLFESTGENCRNFGFIAKVEAKVARELVPAKYKLPSTVYGLVELATCQSGTVAGQQTGAFKIAEAAIMLPSTKGKLAFPFDGPNLYMLWLLDSDPVQSAAKANAGYPGGVVDIQFAPPESGFLRKYEATVGYDGTYTTSGGNFTLKLNVGKKVTDQYHDTPAGTVHTINTIDKSLEGGGSIATLNVAPNSVLARLFGKTKVTGIGFAGLGNYQNVTELITSP